MIVFGLNGFCYNYFEILTCMKDKVLELTQ